MKIMKLDSLTSGALKQIVDCHGAVIYPTDTLYGLGCDAQDELAVKKVYEIKGRDNSKPFSIICPGIQAAGEIADISGNAGRLVQKLLPGPYTFVAAAKARLPYQGDTIAFRIPEGRFAEIVSELGVYFVSTSANPSGKPAPFSFRDIPLGFMRKADLAVDGGGCKYAAPSTIIDLAAMKILRKGAFNPEHAGVLKELKI